MKNKLNDINMPNTQIKEYKAVLKKLAQLKSN